MRIQYLYVFIPLSIVFYLMDYKTLCFVTSFLSMFPLSYSISSSTENLSRKVGDKIGGLINATTGNIPELLICFFALNNHMYELAKSGLIGSIISNLLLVLGISIFFGGIKYSEQKFNKNITRTNFGLLFLALIGIILTSIYQRVSKLTNNINELSLGIAIILLLVYILGLVFSLITHRNLFIVKYENEDSNEATAKIKKPLLILIVTSILLLFESRILVDTIEFISNNYGISESFLGIIVVPLVGNVAEYTTAIMMALKNKVSLCIEIAIGSGIQIALFVSPILAITCFALSNPVTFAYNYYHITCLIVSIGLSFYVFQDGKTYWIEGALLLASYLMIALGYFFM